VPYRRAALKTAAPLGISGRTSYLRVRLAFHPYPQLLPDFCTSHGFGPSGAVRRPAAWPWVAHPVSGRLEATGALFRLAFAPTPPLHRLSLATPSHSPAHSSIGTPSRSPAPTACRHTGSGSFHPPSGVLFTFPSRYSSTIGRQEYLALEGGPPRFPRDSTCPVVLRYQASAPAACRLRGCHPLRPDFPAGSSKRWRPPGRPAALPHLALQPRARNGRSLGTDTVWAPPRSLTTTGGISVDFCSSGY
jgi:hypothetical protein